SGMSEVTQQGNKQAVADILPAKEEVYNRAPRNVLAIFALTLFLIVFSTFVLTHITESTLWQDEAASANIISNNVTSLLDKSTADAQPLFYTYTLKLWGVLFSDSALSLRLYSFFFALLLIVFIYKIAREFFGEKISVTASMLASTSYFLIWFSMQVRVYTIGALLCILSYYLFCKLTEHRSKTYTVLYLLVTTSGMYAHPWFYFVLVAQIISALVFDTQRIKALLFTGAVLLFALPGMITSSQLASLGANSWIGAVTFNTILDSFSFLSYGSTLLYTLVTFASVVWILSGDEPLYSGRRQSILLMHFFIPLLLALLVSLFSPIYVAGRYEMILFPIFATLLAIVWSKIDYRILFFVFFLLVYLTAGKIEDRRTAVEGFKSDDRRVTEDILKRAEKGDLIITTDLSWSTVHYYVTHSSSPHKDIELFSFPREIEQHPGWKNMDAMLNNKEKYTQEAGEIVEKIKTRTDIQNVWVLHNSKNEINVPLIELLKKQFTNYTVEKPESPRENSWFDEVYTFKIDR
ncbi:MAG: glycosyltransferase family 39 protein, partial [Candidatus Taylorbacteria bacterium]|nr:glycosyltransferase family 39 protein [Candidatus Taylorbacteria bacterium]